MLTRPVELHKVWGLSLKENTHKLKFNMGQYFYLYGYEKYSIVCFFLLFCFTIKHQLLH